MSALSRISDFLFPPAPTRSVDWANLVGGWQQYPLIGPQQTISGKEEKSDGSFLGHVMQGYKTNSVVFACMQARQMIFSEARFQFRRLQGGRPGDLFGTQALEILERPWPSGTTGDLLSKVINHADLAGNAYVTVFGNELAVLRPDWVNLLLEPQAGDVRARIVGLVYYPGGEGSGRDPVVLQRSQFAHFAPIPDPVSPFRGMSWLTPLIREFAADSAASRHKLAFFENGATVNLVLKADPLLTTSDAFEKWVAMMEDSHRGAANAYRTLYLQSGADVEAIGADMQQMEFKATQGAGETRIAAASGIHPVIVGLSEGMQGSSLNAGNFNSARRLVADKTMRPLWRNIAGSLETIVPPPPGAQLWYDDRDIGFLREDRKDAAEIEQIKASSIRTLFDAGFTPESIVEAVEAEDYGLLRHSGLPSVQSQPASTTPTNGNGKAPDDALTALLAGGSNG